VGEITTLIRAANAGDRQAVDRLFELLYADLHQLAHARLRASPPNTFLNTTALLHEAYMRFVKAGQLDVDDRRHFLAYAARVMRSIVVDFARRRNAGMRGGGKAHDALDPGVAGALQRSHDEILRVHEGLEALGRIDDGLARLVEMRYFAGLQVQEIAEALGVTERTVERQWHKARAVLFSVLR
jgi:RNA polymerase sigma factor (TIGR02999 family)